MLNSQFSILNSQFTMPEALEAVTRSYEQVCFIVDENTKDNLQFTKDNVQSRKTASLKVESRKTTQNTILNSQFSIFNFQFPMPKALEAGKNIETVEKIWDFLFAQGMTRRGLLVAVGGGVLTDIAGFAAATYKRGIDWVAVPTTLLAMVDASTGGKTGINYKGLKNSIGAFHAPKATLIWPQWLQTLPPQQFLSGFGEMLKTGLVGSTEKREESTEKREQSTDRLWDALLRYDLEAMEIAPLTPLIAECVAAKERIVAADPHEEGLRKVLNFGHTFGHALEEVESRKTKVERHQMLHGYAVVYGMIAELYLSVIKLGCPREPLQQLTQLMLHYYGRPNCSCKDRGELIRLMQQDKKNEHAAEINCTLLQSIGHPIINQVITPAEADEALEYLFSL